MLAATARRERTRSSSSSSSSSSLSAVAALTAAGTSRWLALAPRAIRTPSVASWRTTPEVSLPFIATPNFNRWTGTGGWQNAWSKSQIRPATTLSDRISPSSSSSSSALGFNTQKPSLSSASPAASDALLSSRTDSPRATPLANTKSWSKTAEVIEYYKAWLESLQANHVHVTATIGDDESAPNAAPTTTTAQSGGGSSDTRFVKAAESAIRRKALMSKLSEERKLSEDDKLLIAQLGDEASSEIDVAFLALSEPDEDTMLRFFGTKKAHATSSKYPRRPAKAALLAQWLASQGKEAAVAPLLSESDVQSLHAKIEEIDRKLALFLSAKEAEGGTEGKALKEDLSEKAASAVQAQKRHAGPVDISASSSAAIGSLTTIDEVDDDHQRKAQSGAQSVVSKTKVAAATSKPGATSSQLAMPPSTPAAAAASKAPAVVQTTATKTVDSNTTNSKPAATPASSKASSMPSSKPASPPSKSSPTPALKSQVKSNPSIAPSGSSSRSDSSTHASSSLPNAPTTSQSSGPSSTKPTTTSTTAPKPAARSSSTSTKTSAASAPPAAAVVAPSATKSKAKPSAPSTAATLTASKAKVSPANTTAPISPPSAADVLAHQKRVSELQARVDRLERSLTFANGNLTDAQIQRNEAQQVTGEVYRERTSAFHALYEANKNLTSALSAKKDSDEAQVEEAQTEVRKARAAAASAREHLAAVTIRYDAAKSTRETANSTYEAADDVVQLAKKSSDDAQAELQAAHVEMDKMMAAQESTSSAPQKKVLSSAKQQSKEASAAVAPQKAKSASTSTTSSPGETGAVPDASAEQSASQSSSGSKPKAKWIEQEQRKWDAMTDEASTSPIPLHGQIPPSAPPPPSGGNKNAGSKGAPGVKLNQAGVVSREGDGTVGATTLSTEGKRYLAKKAEEERRRRLREQSEANKIAFREKALQRLQEQQARKATKSAGNSDKSAKSDKFAKPSRLYPADSVVVHIPIEAAAPPAQVLEAVAASSQQKDDISAKVEMQRVQEEVAQEVMIQAKSKSVTSPGALQTQPSNWRERLVAMFSRINLVRAFWQYIEGAWGSRVEIKPAVEAVKQEESPRPLTQRQALEARRAATEKFIDEVLEPSLGVFTDTDGASCHMRFRIHLAQMHKKLVNTVDPEDEASLRHEWLRWLQRDGIVIARHRNSALGETKKGTNDHLRTSARSFYNRWATQDRERTVEIFTDASFAEFRASGGIGERGLTESGVGCKMVGVGEFCAPLPPGISTSGDAEIAAVVFATNLMVEHLKAETLKLGRIPRMRLMFLTDCIGNLELVRTFWDIEKAKRIRHSQKPTSNTEGLVRLLRNDLLMLRENFGAQITLSWLPRDTPNSTAADRLAKKGRTLSSKPADYQPDIITNQA